MAYRSTQVNKKSRIRCPACGKSPKDNTCAVKIDDQGACWFCHRCHESGYCRPADVANLIAGAIVSNSAPRDPKTAIQLFKSALEITAESAAGKYLIARGCALPPSRSHLRWVTSHKHPSGYEGPALISLLSDPAHNTFKTLHRTWIKEDGTKPIEPARLYWPGLQKQGGVCKLWPDDVVELSVGLAEGIENALSLARVFTPVWATVDAGNMEDFPNLNGIESLTVAVDNDPAGIKACDLLMKNWRGEFRVVRVATDLNDWLREAA